MAPRAARFGKDVFAVAIKLACSRVERYGHVLSRTIAGFLDGSKKDFDGFVVALQIRGEATLIANGGRQATRGQKHLERMEGLNAPSQRLGEGRRTDREEHELLEIHVVRGVPAAVEHVHHRHRQDERLALAVVHEAAEVFIERYALR
jgi:hypothetical protein